MAEAAGNPLDPGQLFDHVQDTPYFHVPMSLAPEGSHGHIYLPQIFGFQITKFMVLELVAAALVIALFGWLAAHLTRHGHARGRLANMLEVLVMFIRDDVARSAVGRQDGDKFFSFLATIFFFILFNNLLGLVPWAGSPTGAFAMTSALAIITFLTVIGAGMAKLGVAGFWAAQVPHMELPLLIAIFLKPMIFFLEVLGLFIKHFVLSVRLLANMVAGHLVLAVMLAFIAVSASEGPLVWYTVTGASISGSLAISLLELLVAFIQAYIFTFLAALFIGMAVHPH